MHRGTPGSTARSEPRPPVELAVGAREVAAAAGSASQITRSPWILDAGAVGSPVHDAAQRVVLLLAHDRDDDEPGPGEAAVGEGHARVGVGAERVVVHDDQPARIGGQRRGLGEQRRGVPVGAEPEVDEVELAELADAQLVRVGALLAAHREVGVGRADPIEQRLAAEPVVRRRVVEGDAALVAPVDVDLPPVDLGAAVAGQPLVAGASGVAAGQRQRERVARAGCGTSR